MQSKEIRFLGQSCSLLSPEQGIQLGWWLPVNILLLFFLVHNSNTMAQGRSPLNCLWAREGMLHRELDWCISEL